MCELFGAVSPRRRRANAELREFFSHADENPHGWGLAVFDDSGRPRIDKGPESALKSESLSRLLDAPVESRTVVAHIRHATIGGVECANCHPFAVDDNYGRAWTLAHNGTIFGGVELNGYFGAQTGDTDSERLLLYLVDQVDREQARLRRPLSRDERFAVLDAMVRKFAPGNKLNLLVFDGEVLYAHSNFRGSLHFRRDGDSLLFATRPLSPEGWKLLPFTRLVSAKDGEFVREGASHDCEYVYNPEDYRLVYLNFSRL